MVASIDKKHGKMSTEKRKGPNICLGHLSTWEILSFTGFSTSCDREEMYLIPDFSGKHIADFACGFSDLLSTIGEVSKPLSLTGVDVIFQDSNSQSEAEKKLLKYLQEYKKLFLAQLDGGEEKAYQTVCKLQERVKVLLAFSHKENIDYISGFTQEYIGKMDIIFINFFLYSLQSPQECIRDLKKYLSPTGRIIVVDFDSLRRNLPASMITPLTIQNTLFAGEIRN